MADQDELSQLRALNLQKATRIRQMGFKSSIHALPPEAKLRLDQLLTARISPKAALGELCQQFPRLELPSPKAVEHYRNKYHKATLSKKITLIANREIEMDLQKLKIQRSLLEQVSFISLVIMPKLMKRLETILDREDQIGLPLKMTNDALYALVATVKMLTDVLNQNGVYLFSEEKVSVANKQEVIAEPPVDLEEARRKLNLILERRGLKIDRQSFISAL